jgi:DNA-binding NarL/FixJ family response regulator
VIINYTDGLFGQNGRIGIAVLDRSLSLSSQREHMSGLRLLIADDHDVVRRGVRTIVEDNPNWKIVAEASDGQQAIEKANEFKPDVAILDFSMPKIDGLAATREILKNLPHTKVLIFTIHDSDVLIEEVRQAGAHGYIRKSESDRDLISAIKALVGNKTFYPPAMTTNLHQPLKRDRRKPQLFLTPRQKEIVTLLAKGLRSEKIAEMLGISAKTVETHRRNILSRTNCHSTAELVRYAIRNGFIVA